MYIYWYYSYCKNRVNVFGWHKHKCFLLNSLLIVTSSGFYKNQSMEIFRFEGLAEEYDAGIAGMPTTSLATKVIKN